MADIDQGTDQTSPLGQGKGRDRKRTPVKRRRLMLVAVLLSLLLLLAAAPTIVCNSPLIDSIVRQTAERYGWQAQAYVVHIGWLTPLRAEKIELVGPSGQTKLDVQTIQCDRTLADLLFDGSNFGTIRVETMHARIGIDAGSTTLEQDLASLQSSENEASDSDDSVANEGAGQNIRLNVRDAAITLVDLPTQQEWSIEKIAMELSSQNDLLSGELTANVVDPSGSVGELVSRWSTEASGNDGPLKVDAELKQIPLSLAKLLSRRFPSGDGLVPESITGVAVGSCRLTVDNSGAIRGDFRSLDLRDFRLKDQRLSDRPWTMASATLNGSLMVASTQLQGVALRLTSDVGVAELNGIIRLDGASAIEPGQKDGFAIFETLIGTAGLEIDVARLTKAAPGLLPLRERATIDSAIVRGTISGVRDTDGFRTNLDLESDPVRATSYGRTIQIEPMTVALTARPSGAWLMAERLQIRSMFANATGNGDLRRGQADFNVDLGRLATMLSPLVDLGETELGGSAAGKIEWTAEQDNVWRLSGQATAAKLVIGLEDDKSIREPSVDLKVDAEGVWGNDRLQRLNSSHLTLRNASQTWNVQLEQPIDQPTSDTLLPVKAVGNGRVEAIMALVQPWLPQPLESVAGQFDAVLQADIAATDGVLRSATIRMQQPQIQWDGRRYRQESLNVVFDGRMPIALDHLSIEP
ncbi:MAG: hypothetical protein R3C05_02785 [Pirellulaceae bacterium]